ncbi:MAG: hypothetical protein ACXVID_11570, partial [Thermoanaerobaculia bacterium]
LLAKTLGGAAAAAFLPGRSDAADAPASHLTHVAESRTEALVEAALSTTPASLTAEQRLDVRRGVRDLQKTLVDARRASLGYDVDPATVFLAGGRR